MYDSETWTIKQDMIVIHTVKLRYVRTVRTVSEQAVTRMKIVQGKGKGKVHPCTGIEVLYRLYGP